MGLQKERRQILTPGGETYKDVVVTSAQILALFTTPVAILAAPRAGYVHLVRDAAFHKPAGTAYTIGSAGAISLRYTDASGLEIAQIAATGFMDQSTAQTRYAKTYNAASGASSVAVVTAAAVVIHQATANMTAGTSPLRVRVWYRTIKAAF